jgi:hypothetical protein
VEQKRIVGEVERILSVIQEIEFCAASNLARAQALRISVLAKQFLQPETRLHNPAKAKP